jgi:tetratricopeptide (TPR) repeat protein
MECKNCGTVNDPDGKFCKECGNKLVAGNLPSSPGSDSHVRIGELIYAAYKYKETGQVEDAMLACEGAIALKPDNAQAHSLLASLHEYRGDLHSAVSEYEKVVALNPDALAELATLDVLRTRLNASAKPVGWLEARLGRFAPHAPKIAAAVAFALVVIVGSLWIKSTDRHPDLPPLAPSAPIVTPPPSPQVTAPVQPVGRAPEEGAAAGQGSNVQPQATPSAAPNEHAVPPSRTIPHDQPASQIVKPKVQKSPGLVSRIAKLFVRPVTPTAPSSNNSESTPVIVPVDDPPIRQAPAPSQPAITPSGSIRIRHSAPAARAPKPASSFGPEDKAYSLQRLGKYDEAIASYHEAMSHTNDAGRLYQQIGICYKRLGKNDAAADNFNRAIQSYKDQLAAGGDSSDLARRIKTCEAEISAN